MRRAVADPEPLSPRRTGATRVGGRSERVVGKVFSATISELARVGYVALRVEVVAEKAEVNKTTVYRRWPTKRALVAEAIRSVSEPLSTVHLAGTLKGDLKALLETMAQKATRKPFAGIARMMSAEINDPEVEKLARDLRKGFYDPWIAALNESVKRGELPPGSDVALIVELCAGAVVSRARLRLKITPQYLDSLLTLILEGARHGGATKRKTAS